ncbi:unnamed protein product [Lathyrus sativus]|nr:unnamed protein product [Lathyrus sativus]
MTCGRGRGRGKPHRKVPSSTENPTMVVKEKGDAGCVVQTKVVELNESQDDVSLSEEDEENVLHQETLGESSTTRIEASQEKKKLWVDDINENRNPAKGLTMEFVASTVIDGEI